MTAGSGRTPPGMNWRLWLRALLLAGILALTAARFLQLEADFPWGATWSASPYTDEGWYTNGAVNKVLTGHWRQEGDYNPIVSLPVYFLVQSVTLRLLGVSLASARTTTLGFYLVLLVCVYLIARRHVPMEIALLGVLLLSANFTVFIYSRMALVDLPAAALASLALLLADSFRRRPLLLPAILSGLTVAAAVLTKTPAVAVLPAVLYLNWRNRPDGRQGVRAAAAALATVCLLLGAYYFATEIAYPEDRACFRAIVFEPHVTAGIGTYAAHLVKAVRGGFFLDVVLYAPVLAGAVLAWFTIAGVRRQPLFTGFLLWMVIHLLVMAAYGYLPDRYYVPLAIPLAVLAAAAGWMSYKMLRGRLRLLLIPISALLALSLFGNIRAIDGTLREPRYSLRDTARDLRARIAAGGDTSVVLTGICANTFGLAAGLRSVNANMGPRDAEWRLRTYRPTHYLQFVEDMNLLATLDGFGLLDADDHAAEENLSRALADPRKLKVLDSMNLVHYEKDASGRPKPVMTPWLEKIRRRSILVASRKKRFYYMTDLADVDFLETLDRLYDPQLLVRYDVFGNYIHHSLDFFRLRPREPGGTTPPAK